MKYTKIVVLKMNVNLFKYIYILIICEVGSFFGLSIEDIYIAAMVIVDIIRFNNIN